MKARISNDNRFLDVYTDDFLGLNNDKIINGQLVSEWNLVDITDEESFYLKEGYTYVDNAWVAPEPIEPIIEVPQTISKMKLRMQLILSGIPLASIYAAIEQIPNSVQKEIVYTKWEHAVTFDRTDETLNAMAQMLGITEEQLNTIFIEGNKLQ